MEIPINSKYKERIRYLLENPSFSRTLLDERIPGLFSNCHGTSLWVLGAEDKIKGSSTTIIQEGVKIPDKLSRVVDFLGLYALDCVVLPETDRPFYMGGRVMKDFLSTHCEPTDKQLDTLFLVKGWMESLDGLDYEDYVHSGIFLGGDEDVCFEQYNRGGEFRVSFLEESVREHSIDLSGLEFFKMKHQAPVAQLD